MTSAVFEARNYEMLKPVIDFAELHGVFVRPIVDVEPFATEEEATEFATNISLRTINEAW